MKTCKDCCFCNKELTTKCRDDYIFCNRLGFWRSNKNLCGLINQSIVKIKLCKHCLKPTAINNFSNDKSYKDGLSRICKDCRRMYTRNYYRTIKGLVSKIYNNQKRHSKHRKNEYPSYTSEELYKWILNQDLFPKLYDIWVKSGYKKELIPSIDRKDDYKGYSFDNIQLMTWGENKIKGDYDRKNGINNKMSKAVLQFNRNGDFIKEYYSILQASRENGLHHSHICRACKGKLKTTGGFVWKYKISTE